ncbi:MAG: hypothetical protein WDO68_06710 [Gammaproteobacteria bacterium]
MNTTHAGQARETTGLLQRLARWMKGARTEHSAHAEPPEPAIWPECVGHPYVIGPGTLLVMTYMRKRMR